VEDADCELAAPTPAWFFEEQYASKVATASCEIFSFIIGVIIPHFMRFGEKTGATFHRCCIPLAKNEPL
jgi:hypothetical protein